MRQSMVARVRMRDGREEYVWTTWTGKGVRESVYRRYFAIKLEREGMTVVGWPKEEER